MWRVTEVSQTHGYLVGVATIGDIKANKLWVGSYLYLPLDEN